MRLFAVSLMAFGWLLCGLGFLGFAWFMDVGDPIMHRPMFAFIVGIAGSLVALSGAYKWDEATARGRNRLSK